jgi:hypothetical protein
VLISYPTQSGLALVISYSLLDFCGKDWSSLGWNKDGIYFYQSNTLSLRPMLVTPAEHVYTNEQIADATAFELKLLYHGILLMEIFQQEPISFQPTTGTSISGLRISARTKCQDIDWGTSERYQCAVTACIEGDMLAQLNDAESPHDSFAQNFSERVLDLLEADFAAVFDDKDPDTLISTSRLRRVEIDQSDQSLLKQEDLNVNARHSRSPGPGPRRPKPEKLKV